MAYFDISGGHMVADEGGRKSLDTRVPMLNTVPDAAINLTGYAISWPTFWCGTIFEQTANGPDIFGDWVYGCSSWVGLIEQEWGPAAAAPHNLPDITIGTVPPGTNYLEIWVKLTRTVVPAKMFDLTLASNFPEGEWVKLDGTSCVVEELMGVSRQFEFVLDGTTLKIRREQSVNRYGGVISIPVRRQTPGPSSGNETFFFPGTNAPLDSSKYATYGEKIQELQSRNIPAHRPNGYESGSASNVACSMSHSGKSYASTWAGDIKITPGCFSGA